MRVLVLIVLACVAAAAGEARTFGQIGVLNLEKVFQEAKIYTTRRDELKAQKDQAEAELAKLDQSIRQNENDLSALNRANPKTSQLEDQLEVDKLRRKQYLERARGELERRQVAILKDSYGIIRDHLKQFCVDKGIRLVHLAPSSELSAPSMPELQLQLGLQAVLFYDASLDITEPFLAYVNASFAADQAKLQAAAAQPQPQPQPQPNAQPQQPNAQPAANAPQAPNAQPQPAAPAQPNAAAPQPNAAAPASAPAAAPTLVPAK